MPAIGVITFELRLDDAHSLKDKRHYVKSLKDRLRAKFNVAVAEIDYQRTVEAQQKAPDLVVRQSLDAAKGRYEVAKANLSRAETLLQFCKITAPFSGVITKRWVDPGAFIPVATSGSAAANAALVTITDYSIVRVQVAVPEPETPFIRNGLPVKVIVEELTGPALSGSITRYSHSLDNATRTMLAEIELPNPKGQLLPGMYAMVKLSIESRTNTMLLPLEALVVEKAGTSVFTVKVNMAAKVSVKTGFNDGAFVEILNGLNSTDPVILVGKQILAQGQRITTTEVK